MHRFSASLFFLLVFFFFSSSYAQTPGVSDDAILIGSSAVLTGPVAGSCKPNDYGIKAWFDKVNAEGGVNGRQIKLKSLDDAYSAQRALANARRLVTKDKVFALIGSCGSPPASAIRQYAETVGDLPYLFPWAGERELYYPTKHNIFALQPDYTYQIQTLLPYVLANTKSELKTASLILLNVPGIDKAVEAATDIFREHGIEVAYTALIEVNASDYTSFILKMKDVGTDIAIINSSSGADAQLINAMKGQSWHPEAVLGLSTFAADVFLNAVEKGYTDGWLTAVGVVAPHDHPDSLECRDAITSFYPDVDPGEVAIYGCFAAQMTVEALKRAGDNPTRESFIAALESFDNEDFTVAAPVTFTADDHLAAAALLPIGTQDGKFVVLDAPIAPQ